LIHYYFAWTTPKYHGVAAAILLAGWCGVELVLAGLVASIVRDAVDPRPVVFNTLLVASGLFVIVSACAFYRPALEGTVEFVLWPVYRVTAVGPGVPNLPTRGPYLVIGNHAAWFDPLFLAKALPMPITPMMTSKFYDLPVLSWIMRHVIGTIRVPEMPFRHEAPELKEAVAALDSGKCVVLFPEGYLRRKEEQPLRRFGRGVWKILSDRPATPVFACWIEGNWGSYFSHRGGPPTKGKRIDFWTHIRIGIVGPLTIDSATLADHLATRMFLMHQVASAREPLGLPPIDLPAVPADGDKE
jgi:1-acyl-sn-glycerol-3-phosphate acyltransferase